MLTDKKSEFFKRIHPNGKQLEFHDWILFDSLFCQKDGVFFRPPRSKRNFRNGCVRHVFCDGSIFSSFSPSIFCTENFGSFTPTIITNAIFLPRRVGLSWKTKELTSIPNQILMQPNSSEKTAQLVGIFHIHRCNRRNREGRRP